MGCQIQFVQKCQQKTSKAATMMNNKFLVSSSLLLISQAVSFSVRPSVFSIPKRASCCRVILFQENNNDIGNDGEQEPIFVEGGSDIFTAEEWEEIEENQPSELSIMKEVSLLSKFVEIIFYSNLITKFSPFPTTDPRHQYFYVHSGIPDSSIWRPQFDTRTRMARRYSWHQGDRFI